MDNYIVLHGVKMELTEEQIKFATGNVEPKKSEMELAFERCGIGFEYNYISKGGKVHKWIERSDSYDDNLFESANYCKDESLLKQRALQEILSRQLWRFSLLNGGDKIELNNDAEKFYIYRNAHDDFDVDYIVGLQTLDTQLFISKEIANRAIEEIVKPFIGKHPELTFA